MNPENVGAGVITGGWEFVTTAYLVLWTVLIAYNLSIWWRIRSENAQ